MPEEIIDLSLDYTLLNELAHLPWLSKVRILAVGGPSNIELFWMASINRRRNSRLGPPWSTASSDNPLSSVNFTCRVLLGERVLRRNPLQAPSQTFRRFMLNREMLFGWICIYSQFLQNILCFSRWHGTTMDIWSFRKRYFKKFKKFQNNYVVDLHDTNLEN